MLYIHMCIYNNNEQRPQLEPQITSLEHVRLINMHTYGAGDSRGSFFESLNDCRTTLWI